MGAAAIRHKESFERIMGPLLRVLYPIDTEDPDFWWDLELSLQNRLPVLVTSISDFSSNILILIKV